MAITCLSILLTTLVVANVYQTHSAEQSSSSIEESENPVIKNVNKNTNVIVNMNPKEIATELWKIIESRLNNQTNATTSSKSIKKDLEEVIISLVSPSRRSATPSAFQVANQLDKITRRALTRNNPSVNMLDQEIITRDVVADMMASIKVAFSKQNQSKIDKNETTNRRMMSYMAPISNDNEQNDYVDVRIKILRKDILHVLH